MKWFATRFLYSLGLFLLLAPSTYAALVLSSTRFIYDEERSSISVSVTNYADNMFGGQIWIENTKDSSDIPFSVVPNMFTLEKDKQQRVQVSILDSDIFNHKREVLFWLNLQEIPLKSKDDNEDGNVLRMAARTQVKMIYRPKEIKNDRENAEENITIHRSGDKLLLKNSTPYYFAVVRINQQPTNDSSLTSFSPYSEASYPLPKQGSANLVSFSAIDDWGEIYDYNCDLTKQSKQCQRVIKDR